MQAENKIQNPHLEGKSFDWQAGRSGVLLVHGFTATTSEVRPLAKVLLKHGYSVAGPLLPGHGSTPAELNRCRWQDWTRAVDEAYRKLSARCDRVVIGGESMGGLLALYAGAEHPEAAAVLAFAPAIFTNSAGKKLLAGLAAPFKPYMQKTPGPPSAADALWQGYTVNPVRAVRQLFLLQDEVRRRLPLLRRPLLVAQGRLDHTVAPTGPDLIVRAARSTLKQVDWYERSGHCVLLDVEFEQVAARTIEFLAQVLD